MKPINSFPSSAEVKNTCCYVSTHPPARCHGFHIDKFTFTFERPDFPQILTGVGGRGGVGARLQFVQVTVLTTVDAALTLNRV